MGLQPKQPRGRAGPGQWEATFSCQGGARLRLSPSLRGPTTAGASMPVRLEVEPARGHTSDSWGQGCTSTCCCSLTGKSLGGAGLSLSSGPLVGVGNWGQVGHLQVAWASSRQKRARGPGRGSVAQDGTEPSAPGRASFLATGLTSPAPTQSPGSLLCPP